MRKIQTINNNIGNSLFQNKQSRGKIAEIIQQLNLIQFKNNSLLSIYEESRDREMNDEYSILH